MLTNKEKQSKHRNNTKKTQIEKLEEQNPFYNGIRSLELKYTNLTNKVILDSLKFGNNNTCTDNYPQETYTNIHTHKEIQKSTRVVSLKSCVDLDLKQNAPYVWIDVAYLYSKWKGMSFNTFIRWLAMIKTL